LAAGQHHREAKEGNAMTIETAIELLIIVLRIVSAGMAH
jgi:hypothetical protein